MLPFNRGTNQPLGIVSKFPIALGGKIVYLDLMVFQGPLDFNLLLDRDYVYVMGALVSSLFCVICFAHEERIVTIDKISFIHHDFTPDQPSSLNGPCMNMESTPPQVNYVATCSVPTSTDDLVNDIMFHVLGALELDISIRSLYNVSCTRGIGT